VEDFGVIAKKCFGRRGSRPYRSFASDSLADLSVRYDSHVSFHRVLPGRGNVLFRDGADVTGGNSNLHMSLLTGGVVSRNIT
jgi:hypothetical protein